MTGPDHYREAERLIGDNVHETPTSADVALAQVHATLALAAATAMAGHSNDGLSPIDFRAWDKVCGVQEEDEATDGTDV